MKTQYVHPTQLSDSDIALIAKGCLAVKFNPMDPKVLVEKAVRRELFLYKLIGEDFFGITALYITDDCLYVELVVGKGLVRHFSEIHDWLMQLALSCGLHKLSALIARPGLQRLWQKHEARNAASYMTKEITHG